MSEELYDQYLARMMSLCSKSEKCASDIQQKLSRLDIPEKTTHQIIEYLKEHNFIDHHRYVEAYINDKLRFNQWGKRKIAHALHAKNIEDSIIQEKLNKIDPQWYDEILKNALERKLKPGDKLLDAKEKEKIIRYLLQKGFEYGKIFDIIEERTNSEQS